ncbi:MAG: transporter [Deltaproteobacteria bacterium]|nr:transporter [Deltaproteobacteria bacterium]
MNFIKSRIRFDRNELSGAFGDIGTDLPLILGMIACSGINGAGVFVVFGLMQVATALIYGIPMPVQPLKAVALIVITQKIGGEVLYGGGLAIGLVMFFLAVSGVIDRLGKIIPLAVVRGIQMGLGLQLSMLALKDYIPSDSTPGFLLAGTAFIITLLLIGNRRFPPALPVIILGAVYGFVFKYDPSLFSGAPNLFFHGLHLPSSDSLLTGFLVLALPQIPLSLGNSVYASSRIINDYFPEKPVSVRKIGFTYSLMNLVAPFLGGLPVCHGSGGLAGHYAFGARTGGSIVIYGALFVLLGLFSAGNVTAAAAVFPKPVLGVILLFEGISLLNLMRDMAPVKNNFVITVLVALAAVCLPYGYLIGMAAGTALYYLADKRIIGIADPVQVGR